jgi:P27 family predicted phage terminase small subunit
MKKDTRKKSNRMKLLSGNPGKRPVKDEPKYSKPDENPPDSLDEIGKAEWVRIAPELREEGVLTKMDEAILYAYCEEFSTTKQCAKKIHEQGLMIRRTPRSKVLTLNPYLAIKQKSVTLLKSLACELGLTPVSRGRVSVKTIPKDDPYKALRERRAKSLADAQAKLKKKTKSKTP